MKRLLMLTMVLALVFGFSAGAAAYDDMDGHWANRSVERWTGCQVLYGEGSSFCPDDNLIRGDMALIICRIMGYETMATNEFKDLPADAYYTKAVLKANYAGVIFGDGDGTVRPEDNITREEAAAMFGRALLIQKGTTCDFKDADQISAWAKGAVCALAERKALRGYSDGTVRPLGYITRAEAATLLDNLITVYQNTSGTVNKDGAGFAVVNAEEVTLSDMTFTGEVVATDKVQKLILDNATITESLTTVSFGAVKAGLSLSGDPISNPQILEAIDSNVKSLTVHGSDEVNITLQGKTTVPVVDIGARYEITHDTFTKFLYKYDLKAKFTSTDTITIEEVICNMPNSELTSSANIGVDTLLINTTASDSQTEWHGGAKEIDLEAKGASVNIGDFVNLNKLNKVNLGKNATDNQFICGNMAVELNAGVEYGKIIPVTNTNTNTIPEVINGAAIIISDSDITGQNVQLNLGNADNSAIALGFKPTDYDQSLTINGVGDVEYTKLNLKFNASALAFKEGNFCNIDLSGNNNKINLETVNDSDVENNILNNLNFTGNGNTLTLTGGNNRVTATGNNTTVNANNTAPSGGTGRNTIDLAGDYSIVNSPNSTDNMEVNISGKGAIVKTGKGEDTISVKGNDSLISTGAGDDFITLKGTSAGNSVNTGDGNDVAISVSTGGNTFYADGGNDCIFGGDGNDRIFGGSGSSLLIDGKGTDRVIGGTATDIIWASADSAADAISRESEKGVCIFNYTKADRDTISGALANDILLEQTKPAFLDGNLETIGWGYIKDEGITATIYNNVVNKAGYDEDCKAAVDFVKALLAVELAG